ncbi:hypothetical protein GGI35DRAFT_353329 [Trichoderma velutinum]
MGGGHLLCLIMKPHFFFTRPVSLKKSVYCHIFQFPVFCTRILSFFFFFISCYFLPFPRFEYLFIVLPCYPLFLFFLFSESDLMRKGPVAFFSFTRLSFLCFSLFIYLYLSSFLFSSLSSSFLLQWRVEEGKGPGHGSGRGERAVRYFLLWSERIIALRLGVKFEYFM